MFGALFASCLSFLSLSAAPIDAPIPGGARPMAEKGRYQMSGGYDAILDFYERRFKSSGGVKWKFIVNQPDVKAKHAASLSRKTRWRGINIYSHAGKTYVYVIPRNKKK